MRLNANQTLDLSCEATVYLNGVKEPNAIEVFIPGNTLEGEGYVIRAITMDGKAVPTYGIKPLTPGFYDAGGLMAEKVSGYIRIDIPECVSEFGEQ